MVYEFSPLDLIISPPRSERSCSEPNENKMQLRANQLKKAREDFFLGKEGSPSRPTSLPINPEKVPESPGSSSASDKVNFL